MSNPVEEFLLIKEAKDKEAGWLDSVGKAFSALGKRVAEQVPGALASAGVTAAGVGALAGGKALYSRLTKQRDYQAMMSATPSLRKRPADQVQMMYNSLRNVAPTLAKDPLVAGSFIDNSMELSGDRAMIAPQSAKLLADTQKSITQGRGAPSAILGALGRPYPAPQQERPQLLRETRFEYPREGGGPPAPVGYSEKQYGR